MTVKNSHVMLLQKGRSQLIISVLEREMIGVTAYELSTLRRVFEHLRRKMTLSKSDYDYV